MATQHVPARGAPAGERGGRVVARHDHARWRPAFQTWLTAYRRRWRASIVSRFLAPVLFLLSMGLGLGDLVDQSSGGVDGVPYLQFVAPGILAAQAMLAASGESTYHVLGAIKWQGQYPAMLATPLTVRDVLRGHLTYVALQVTMATAIFMAVSAAFGAVTSWWFLACLPLTVLTGMAFATMMFAYSGQQDNDDGFNILFRFIVIPLFLFSGTFYPVDQLPGFLRVVAWALPLWHGVEGNRELALGTPDFTAVAGHTAYLLLFAGTGAWLAFLSFRKRLVV